jgi:hypothetical protein
MKYMLDQVSADKLTARVLEKANSDAAFRRALLVNPRDVIEAEAGSRIPSNVTIHAGEDSLGHLYVTMKQTQLSGELSDCELDTVSGGVVWPLPPEWY